MIAPCTYCGVPADSIDHIPPQCMRNTLKDLGDYIGVWKEVPACLWCNSTLGSLALLTITDRRDYIKKVIRRKFKKLLASPVWSDADIEECGEGLRAYLFDQREQARLIRDRLAWDGQIRSGQVYEPVVRSFRTTAYPPFTTTRIVSIMRGVVVKGSRTFPSRNPRAG